MKSKNLIAAMANDIFEQWEVCKTARGNDFEKEAKRLDAACKGGEAISDLANIQLRQLLLTGFLPDENILVDGSEIKLINAKRNLSGEPKKSTTNFLNEFVKK